jgi:plasmid maintenance system antidote protein VapI
MTKKLTLKEWCEKDGRGPSALAIHLGISRATFWRLLNRADVIPTPDTAKRIEKATGGKVRAAQLMGLETI